MVFQVCFARRAWPQLKCLRPRYFSSVATSISSSVSSLETTKIDDLSTFSLDQREEAISFYRTLLVAQDLVTKPHSNNVEEGWISFFANLGLPNEHPPVVEKPLPTTPKQNNETARVQEVYSRIRQSIEQKKPMIAYPYIQIAVKEGIINQIDLQLVRGVFSLFERNPIEAYGVLRAFVDATHSQDSDDMDAYMEMYRHMAHLLSQIEPSKSNRHLIVHVVSSLAADLRRLSPEGQEICFPVLISALLRQRSSIPELSVISKAAYQYILDQEFRIDDGFWEHLLSLSKFHRQNDIPYADVLQRIVLAGRHPHSSVVLNALGNLYPYEDVDSTLVMLQSVSELASATKVEGETNPISLDIAMLEAIGAAASAQGAHEINLLIWDLLDLTGCPASESIFESTILAFLSLPSTFPSAFEVLSEMEAQGMKPSRAFCREMSKYLRYVNLL